MKHLLGHLLCCERKTLRALLQAAGNLRNVCLTYETRLKDWILLKAVDNISNVCFTCETRLKDWRLLKAVENVCNECFTYETRLEDWRLLKAAKNVSNECFSYETRLKDWSGRCIKKIHPSVNARCCNEYDRRLDISPSHARGSRMKGVTNWPHEEGWTTPWDTVYQPLERDAIS
jgi:hypothetical protein